MVSNKHKTILCVTVAGLLFMTGVYYNIPWLFVLGAIPDWLPLPTGWMRFSGNANRTWAKIHAAITLAAYAIGVLWVLGFPQLRLVFLETWWLAVMAGTLI